MKRMLLALVGCSGVVGAIALIHPVVQSNHAPSSRRVLEIADRSDDSRMLGALVYTKLSVMFDETPARQVFEYLGEVLGIKLLGRYNDDRTGAGIDPDRPITLDVIDEPVLTILEMVLEQCEADGDECTWQLRRRYVEVGTKTRLSVRSAQTIRYYPLRDLIFQAPSFENAPGLDLQAALSQGGGGTGGNGLGGRGGSGGGRGSGGGGVLIGEPGADEEREGEQERINKLLTIIRDLVEPEAWADYGGDGASIRAYQGTLIVRAPDFIHRQIGGYPAPTRPARSRPPRSSLIRDTTGSR